jgi:hypothetical protein
MCVAGSTVLGLLRALVLREGARFGFCGFVGRGAVELADSAFFWPRAPDWVLLLSFVMTLIKLSKTSK